MQNEPDHDEPGRETVPAPPAHDTLLSSGAAVPRARGTIRSQEPGITRPRPPSVAEARARDRARRARERAEQFAQEQAAKRSEKRKTLMGTVAVVGVAGAVALGYQAFKADREITATCVDENDVVVSDSYCSTGTPGAGGIFIIAGSPYRYYYGGSNGGVGTRATGGTLTQPSGTTARTKSGSSITRGGFGSSSAGSSSGG